MWFKKFFHIHIRSSPKQEKRGKLIYCLPHDSWIDRFVLYLTFRQLQLKQPGRLSKKKFILNDKEPLLTSLQKSSIWNFLSRKKPPPSQGFQDLIVSVKRKNISCLRIVPTIIFWGRHPGREKKSWWSILFYESEQTSFVKKIWLLFLDAGRLEVSFLPPFEVTKFSLPETDEQANKKLWRLLRLQFSHERHVSLGPRRQDDQYIISRVLYSPQVVEALSKQAKRSNRSYRYYEKQALCYIKEIMAKPNYGIIRFFEVFLDKWLWKRFYRQIYAFNFEQIRYASSEPVSVVYVASHRSHVDYLLLSFQLFRHRLGVPITVAGKNLDFWLIGSLLRRGGATFVRRIFSGYLYTTVYQTYIHHLLQDSHAMSVFPEGGRSRTGRLLKPKTGFLSIVVKSYQADSRRKILLVPVYISYDRVFENKSYLNELKGMAKKRESFWDFLSASRYLPAKKSLGNAYLNLAAPIDLGQYLEDAQRNVHIDFNRLVKNLSLKLMSDIAGGFIISTASLITYTLVSHPKHSLSEGNLKKICLQLRNLALCFPSKNKVIMEIESSWESTLQALVKYQNIYYEHSEKRYYIEESQYKELNYSKENIHHCFALPVIVVNYLLEHPLSMKAEILSCVVEKWICVAKKTFVQFTEIELQNYCSAVVDQLLDYKNLIVKEEDSFHYYTLPHDKVFIDTNVLSLLY